MLNTLTKDQLDAINMLMKNTLYDIFKRKKANFDKLLNFGFRFSDDCYFYSKLIMDSNFRIDISINKKGEVDFKVIDLSTNDEYINYRFEEQKGDFVNSIRKEIMDFLLNIINECFENELFISNQANRLSKFILFKYGDAPEFMWLKAPGYGVFRNPINNKWYALIMNIENNKIENGSGEVEIINLKLDKTHILNLLGKEGYYLPYHMKKDSWISIILDDTLTDETIMKLIEESHNNVSLDTINKVKSEWLLPANPKYYDLIIAFKKSNIILWKQSTSIKVNDIVYLYVAAPYSEIKYKCEVLKVDIPYDYKNKKLIVNKVMQIKLIKEFNKEFTLDKLKELGINSIRGPRRLSKALSIALNN